MSTRERSWPVSVALVFTQGIGGAGRVINLAIAERALRRPALPTGPQQARALP
jgi:hypothetical protein